VIKYKFKALHSKKHDLVDDIYGKALTHYFNNPGTQEILVHSDIAETDHYPVSWFFRSTEEFPVLEQKALDLCKGKILDVGAGTGIHSLALQKLKRDVYAIDISPGAVDVMIKQGLINAKFQDFYAIKNEKFDTLLMLMNGFGVMGTIDKVSDFFKKADELLSSTGQIIVDSSDLIHLYTEEDGSVMLDLNSGYHGEIEYQMEFNGELGHPFNWLFIDFHLMQEFAEKAGFRAVKIFEEENNHYLAQITRK